MLRCLWACLAAAGLVTPQAEESVLDPAFVGTFQLTLTNGQGTWTFTFHPEQSGRYATTVEGTSPLPGETGVIQAKDGSWSIKADSGRTDEGTYKFDRDKNLILTGKLGTGLWKRVKSAPGAAPPPKQAESAPAASAPGPAVKGGALRLPSWFGPQSPWDKVPHAALGAEFLEGIDWISSCRFDEARAALTRAVQKNPNAESYVARAVSYALAEQPKAAFPDLRAALRLNGNAKDAQIWWRVCCQSSNSSGADDFVPDLADPFAKRLEEWAILYGGLVLSYDQAQVKLQREAARKQIPELAQLFAARIKGQSSTFSSVYGRVLERAAAGKLADAMADAEALLKVDPDDPTLLLIRAQGLLAAGNLYGAREDFTQVLTDKTDWVAAYLGRAETYVKLGDPKRARADLQIAATLDPARAKTSGLEAALAAAEAAAPAKEPQAAAADLLGAGRSGAAWEPLVEMAVAVRTAMNVARRRYDESYQGDVRVLEDAVRAEPANPQRLVNLGRFMFEQAREWEGRNSSPRYTKFHYASPRDERMARAEECAILVLAADPDNVRAGVLKAAIGLEYQKWDMAESLLAHVLKFTNDSPEVFDLFATIQDHTARLKKAEAKRLLAGHTSSSTHDENRSDGKYRVTTTVWTPPTPEELARSAEYNRQASRLWALAEQYFAKALQAKAGTAEGFYYQGLISWRKDDLAAARRSLEQALKMQPDDERARHVLASVYADSGMNRESSEELEKLRARRRTSALPLLDRADFEITHSDLKSGRESVDKALAIDPAQSMIYAYRGILEGLHRNTAESVACFKCALALEEALLRMCGTTLEARETGSLRAMQVGPAVATRHLLCLDYESQGRLEEMFHVARRTALLESRVPKEDYGVELRSSSLPFPRPEGAAWEPETAATLLALQRFDAGNALFQMKRYGEALQEYLAARELGAQSGRNAVQPVEANARLAAGRTYLKLSDYPKAVAAWENIPRGWQQSQWLMAELKQYAASHSEPEIEQQLAKNRRRMELEASVNGQDRALGRLQDELADLKRQKGQDLAERNGDDLARATAEWDRKIKAKQDEIDEALRAPQRRARGGR
jgi:tetratricopeptide (TPR) repeat protein